MARSLLLLLWYTIRCPKNLQILSAVLDPVIFWLKMTVNFKLCHVNKIVSYLSSNLMEGPPVVEHSTGVQEVVIGSTLLGEVGIRVPSIIMLLINISHTSHTVFYCVV